MRMGCKLVAWPDQFCSITARKSCDDLLIEQGMDWGRFATLYHWVGYGVVSWVVGFSPLIIFSSDARGARARAASSLRGTAS